MGIGDRVPDKTLLQQVNKRLMQAGTQSSVSASVNGGCVTLTGTLKYETQRNAILRKAQQVSGVRHIVDRMTVPVRKRQDQ
jgi:osmotically-inducible protein OsmY